MKHLLALTVALAPMAAQASLGPVDTLPTQAGVHLTEMAWVTPVSTGPQEPGCTDPTPTPETIAEVFACVLGPVTR